MDMTMIDLTGLMEALITLAAALITVVLIPWLREKFGAEKLAKARTWVEVGVYAAEKIYGAGKGQEKLRYVEELLAKKGVRLDTAALSALVDAEIKKMEQATSGGVTIVEHIAEAIAEEEDGEEDEEPQTQEAHGEV